ncbi:MAG TPA: MBL fold metallo-hydrolase [Hyphomicrobiaceae bacterium]|nr:MBL fold metallo-hydrolase [Hyphomicrobiaceae bacterium]
MHRIILAITTLALALAVVPAGSQDKPAPAKPPLYATTQVEGTDNVYVFRYGNHQAMFVVTSAGVIATDPIGYGRPQAVTTYIDEIRKVTKQPIKFLVYSHHHFDHIAGGQPFKDAGATIIAHKRAKERLEMIQDPATPLPDEVFDRRRILRLGDTTLELTYHGLNHSDSTIAMRLPKEKILFVVDVLPVGSVPGRGMIDFYPLEAEKSIEEMLKLDWDRLIPGHPGAPGGRLGTKDDVRAQLTFLRDASEAIKVAAREGKCWDQVEKELKLPKYENWPGYQNNLPFVLRRYCGLWGRGT